MRFAYLDPPYVDRSELYRDQPEYTGEIDHEQLLRDVSSRGYDGWALSCSSDSLHMVVSMCRDLGLAVRTGVWVRGDRGTPSKRVAMGWEPVLYHGGRHGLTRQRPPVDVLVHACRPRRSDPGRIIGMKPAAFAFWMFGLLGAEGGDSLDDWFPGSGGIGRAWAAFQDACARLGGQPSYQPGDDG